MWISAIKSYLKLNTSIFPLAIFRMAFGSLMAFSTLRFLSKGWVEAAYLNPQFHFTYRFFDWVEPFDPFWMYGTVVLCALSALCIGLGYFYRWAAPLFFISFTYLELIEKSWYLNHYYFVSLVAFLLIFLPANRNYSLDTYFGRTSKLAKVNNWNIDVLKLQLGIVYVFGGIAKLKYDWLFLAQPMKFWLKSRTDLPLIGFLFEYDWMPYAFSWAGLVYDLSIVFLLWNKRTRLVAYLLVLVFHILTYVLFNIGMFPWLMIAGSLIFISKEEWKHLFLKIGISLKESGNRDVLISPVFSKLVIVLFLVLQIVFPLRHYFLSKNVLWTENGFRFAWHVMVMEKSGYITYTVIDNISNQQWKEYPSDRLDPIQEKQMSHQPDMILQYARYLENIYKTQKHTDLSIYVQSKVSLNGRPSQVYIDPKLDLLTLQSANDIYQHILPLQK